MGPFITALVIGAGLAAFVYVKVGARIGYGNPQNVWKIVLITFVLGFLVAFILFKTLVSLN